MNIKEIECMDNHVNDILVVNVSCNAVGYNIIHWEPNIKDQIFPPFKEEQRKDGQEHPPICTKRFLQLLPSISRLKVSRKLFGPFGNETIVASTFLLSENDLKT